ncbi:MAG: translation initiation factor IF-2 [Anaerolineales bacterium]
MSKTGTRVVDIPAYVTVRELADLIETSPIDLIKKLMSNGVMANINQQIDFDTAAIVAAELGIELHAVEHKPEAEAADDDDAPAWRRLIAAEDEADLVNRPPVVTVLGHVDHGKTSLLDVIRKTDVAVGEAGGITQHIGAYQIEQAGRKITFLDTPGHEAFTAMRARGSQATDIAILVVAADDGVMPQTREAAAHAKAARVPVVVALNKIDKANANPDRVKRQLSEIGLQPDDWDGDTIVVPVSAVENTGVDDLLEAVLLVADETAIKANPEAPAAGTVIEAEVDKSRGVVATLLVQNGTLRAGDSIVAGAVSGRIRAMFNDKGDKISKAPPSTPVSVLGLSSVPTAGDLFHVAQNDREARTIAAERKAAQKIAARKAPPAISLDQVFAQFLAGEAKELNLIVKADVQGSLEPIVTSLEKLGDSDLKVRLLHTGTGNISENDVRLASASRAIVIGFSVEADQAAQRLAEKEGVSIRRYDVIYRLVEDVDKALAGMLEPKFENVTIGRAEVRAVFRIPRLGQIAGCYVLEGELRRNANARVLRRNDELYSGSVSSLKHEKDDVRDIRQGFECGIGLDGFDGFHEGDVIECFVSQQVV